MPRKIIQKKRGKSAKSGKGSKGQRGVNAKRAKKQPNITADVCNVIEGSYGAGYGAQIKNPMTGRSIKVGGPTYESIRHGCSWCADSRCDNLEESGINPRTGNRLKANSAVKKNMMIGCKSCRVRRAAAPTRQARQVRPSGPSARPLPSSPAVIRSMEDVIALPPPPPMPLIVPARQVRRVQPGKPSALPLPSPPMKMRRMEDVFALPPPPMPLLVPTRKARSALPPKPSARPLPSPPMPMMRMGDVFALPSPPPMPLIVPVRQAQRALPGRLSARPLPSPPAVMMRRTKDVPAPPLPAPHEQPLPWEMLVKKAPPKRALSGEEKEHIMWIDNREKELMSVSPGAIPRVGIRYEELEGFILHALGLGRIGFNPDSDVFAIPTSDKATKETASNIRKLKLGRKGRIMLLIDNDVGSNGKTAAIRVYLNKHKLYSIKYYNPGPEGTEEYPKELRKLLVELNRRRSRYGKCIAADADPDDPNTKSVQCRIGKMSLEELQRINTFKVYSFNWRGRRLYPGARDISNAYIIKYLLEGNQENLISKSDQFEVKDDQIDAAYAWIARNLGPIYDNE